METCSLNDFLEELNPELDLHVENVCGLMASLLAAQVISIVNIATSNI